MSKETFQKHGYTIVRDAVSQELRDFITQYALFDEMQDYAPDSLQVADAHSRYGDPAMETLLLSLQHIMEENTGLELYPTYSYYRVYRPGDVLPPHTDRPACQISTTVCFNYSYDDSQYQWPIQVEGVKLNQKPGDIVIYRGVELEHSRDPFTLNDDNAWHVQGFFHYVDANGPYADEKWDRRPSIGEPFEYREDQRDTSKPLPFSDKTALYYKTYE